MIFHFNLLENHPLRAHSLDAIACVYRCKKDYRNSFDYYTRALTILHKTFKNNEHPLIANCLHRLGNLHEDQDHIDQNNKINLKKHIQIWG
jgi:hypothetical protein